MLKGAPVTTVSIYDCLSNFILWAQTIEKPVLIDGQFDAKALVRACRKVDLVEKLKTAVVGFSNTVPIFKTILPNNSGYTQESVLAAVLGKSYDAHNSLADATILYDVVVHCEIPQNLMLKHSFTTQWAERYVIYLQEQNSRIGSFHPLAQEKIISKGILTKMARSGLEYRHLCIVYQRGGRDGLSSLFTKLNSNNSVRVTNRKNILKAICDYFESTLS